MDSKSKKIFLLLLCLTAISIALTYYRSFVSENFETTFDDYSEEFTEE